MPKSERRRHSNIFQHGNDDLQLEAINGVVFTNREIDIIACILSGKGAKKIAFFLSISPKTVENHIRNIMLKLGCRTQENIIDFIEKSNKFTLVKRHYTNLLLRFFFDTQLKNISVAALKEDISCLIVYGGDVGSMPFMSHAINDLQTAGIKALVKSEGQDELDLEGIDYLIYIHSYGIARSDQVSDSATYPDLNNLIQLSSKHSSSILYLVFREQTATNPLQDFSDHKDIILIQHDNYYFLVFETLKKILNDPLDKHVASFKNQYEMLSASEKSLISFDNNEEMQPLVSTKSKRVGLFIICLFVTVFMLYQYLSVSGTVDSKQGNVVFKIFCNWVRGNEYSHSDISTKYIESLEEEENKLGNLDGMYQTLKFLYLQKNFVKASNRLISLDEKSEEKAEKLVEFLKDKFPANNRTNEKIHKLFFAMASYYGKLSVVEKLLANVDISFIDFKDYYGNTAPMLAAAGNSANTFEWLVKKDALFVNHANIEGNTALILAALNLPSDENINVDEKTQSIITVKKIIEHDRNSINVKGHKGVTPLLVAGAKGNITAVEQMLELMAPNNVGKQMQILEQEKNIDGNSLMLLAAYNGQKHLIEWLHKKKISLRQRNKYHTTTFMQAASGGHDETMEMIYRLHALSSHDASQELINEQNNFGQTALFLAAYDNRVNAFQWILEKVKENNLNNNDKFMFNYINSLRNADGDSLLHVLINGLSVTSRSTDAVLNTGLLGILLNYIDVNTHATINGKATGDTPLMRAANYGNISLVKHLIEKCGADIKEKNIRGETAIFYAAMGGHGQYEKVIEYLWWIQAVNEGESLNKIKKQSSSALFLTAAQYGQKSVLEWLLRNDPELIESQTAGGESALSLAIKNFHIDVIDFIFDWDKRTAIRLVLERRANTSENVLEHVMLKEKAGLSKTISQSKYLEQKIGTQIFRSTNRSTSHNDSSYRWKSLEIGINTLSTSLIQPWSPYYLHDDSKLKLKSVEEQLS